MSEQYEVVSTVVNGGDVPRIQFIGTREECEEFIRGSIKKMKEIACLLCCPGGIKGQMYYDDDGNITQYNLYWDSYEVTHKIGIFNCNTKSIVFR